MPEKASGVVFQDGFLCLTGAGSRHHMAQCCAPCERRFQAPIYQRHGPKPPCRSSGLRARMRIGTDMTFEALSARLQSSLFTLRAVLADDYQNSASGGPAFPGGFPVYPLSSCGEFWVFREPPLSLGLSWRDRFAICRIVRQGRLVLQTLALLAASPQSPSHSFRQLCPALPPSRTGPNRDKSARDGWSSCGTATVGLRQRYGSAPMWMPKFPLCLQGFGNGSGR